MTFHARAIVLAGVLGAGIAPVLARQAPIPAAQTPTLPATGAITGTVVDGSSGEAIGGAIVFIAPADAGRTIPITQTRQASDGRGRFAFTEVPEGAYTVSASKFGFLDGGYGREFSPTEPLRVVYLKSDAWVSNLRVAVWKPGSISGAVRDEAGEPVVGVYVRALARFKIQGRDDLVAGPATTTNDRGEYRLSGLTPGKYIIQVPSVQASVPRTTAMPAAVAGNLPEGIMDIDDSHRLVIGRYPLPPPPVNGRQMAYPIVFHPAGSAVAQAMTIDLKFGDDRPNVDLALVPVPAARVSGIVEGPPQALAQLTLRLLPAGMEHIGFGGEAATALVDVDGRFTFFHVPAGSYTIDAPVKVAELSVAPPSFGGSGFNSRTPGNRFPVPPPVRGSGYSSNSIDLIPGAAMVDSSFRTDPAPYSGRASVTVGASDVNNVVVRLRPHAVFSGRIIVETDPAKPNDKPPSRIPLRLDPAGGEGSLGMPQSSFQQDGPADFFTIPGVQPGQYLLRVSGYANWTAKSITWKGREYLDAPFDTTNGEDFSGITVTVTNAVPELGGSVRGSTAVPVESAMVVVFPVERALWRNTGLNPVRMKSAAVSNTGTYRLTTLPAGDYLVAAIDRSQRNTWRGPEFLARLERSASRVTLNWGGRSSQDLTAVEIK